MELIRFAGSCYFKLRSCLTHCMFTEKASFNSKNFSSISNGKTFMRERMHIQLQMSLMNILYLFAICHSKLFRWLKFHCRFDPEIYKIRHKPPWLLYTTLFQMRRHVYATPSEFMTRHGRESLAHRLCLNRSPTTSHFPRNPARLLNQKSKETPTRRPTPPFYVPIYG